MALSDAAKEHAEELGRQLAKDKLCIIAGAGVSRNPPAELPNWLNLVKRVNENLDAGLEEDTLAKPMMAMGIMEVRKDRGSVVSAMREVLPDNTPTTHIHRRLVSLGCPIYTTNVDQLFEKAAEDQDIPIRVLKCDQDFAHDVQGQIICKLHGDLQAPDTLVLSQGDYHEVMKQEKARGLFTKFRAQLQDSYVLMVGHSANDPDLQWTVDYVKELLGREARPIRVITATPRQDDITRLKGVLGLTPVVLDNYDQLPELLRTLEDSAREQGSASSPPESITLLEENTVDIVEDIWAEKSEEINELLRRCDYEQALSRAETWEQRIMDIDGVSSNTVARIYRIKAICHRQQGDEDAALVEINAALEEAPDNPQNQVELATIRLMSGGQEEASHALKNEQDLDTRRFQAMLGLMSDDLEPTAELLEDPEAQEDANCQSLFATYYYRTARFPEAVQAARKVAEFGDTVHAHERAGDIIYTVAVRGVQEMINENLLLKPDQFEVPMGGVVDCQLLEEATEFYKTARDMAAESARWVRTVLSKKIARSAWMVGDRESADQSISRIPELDDLEGFFERGSSLTETDVEELVEQLKEGPHRRREDPVSALINVAEQLLEHNKSTLALRLLDKAKQMVPDGIMLFWRNLRARALLQDRGLRSAMRELNRARSTPQGEAAVHQFKAQLQAQAGKPESAKKWFARALKSGRFRVSALYRYGMFALSELQDYEKAADLLGELIQLVPSQKIQEVYCEAAIATNKGDLIRRARAELEGLRAKGQADKQALRGLIACYQKETDWKRAREIAEEYLKRWPEDKPIRNNYALFLDRCGEIDLALMQLEKLRTLSDLEPDERFGMLVNRAQILLNAERYRKGYRTALEAKQDFESRAEGWLMLMRACRMLGRDDELASVMVNFHSRFPDHPAVCAETDVKKLVHLQETLSKRSQKCREKYESREIPIHLLAECWGMPLPVIWAYLAKNEAVLCGLHDEETIEAQMQRIDGGTLILDYTALLAIRELDLWDHLSKLPNVIVSQALLDQLQEDSHDLQGRLRIEHRERYEHMQETLEGSGSVSIHDQNPRQDIPDPWIEEHGWITAADLWHAEQAEGVVLDDISDTLPPSRILRTDQLLQCLHREGWLSRSDLDDAIEEINQWPSHIQGGTEAPLVVKDTQMTTPIVLSINAIESLERLDMLELVASRCSQAIVSSATWSHFASELAQLRFFKRTKENQDHLRNRATSIDVTAVEKREVQAAGLKADADSAYLQHNWCLARKDQSLLWTDDAVLRAYTEKRPVVEDGMAVTTIAVLHWLKENGHLDEEDFRRRIQTLTRLQYQYVVPEADDLLWTMREYNWQITEEAAETLRYYGGLFEHVKPNVRNLNCFFQSIEELLCECWQLSGRSQTEKADLANWILENIMHPRWYEERPEKVRRVFLDRMLLVLWRMPVAGARRFGIWLRDYFMQEGMPAKEFAEALGDLLREISQTETEKEEKEKAIVNILVRLPVCLRRMIPEKIFFRISHLLEQSEGTLQVLEAKTAQGTFSLAQNDVKMLAEDQVERHGAEAINENLRVEISADVTRYAFCEEEDGVLRWPSYPSGLRQEFYVDATELLTSWSQGVRKSTAAGIASRINDSSVSFVALNSSLHNTNEWNDEQIRDLRTIAHSPAVRLLFHGGESNEQWIRELLGTSWETIQNAYGYLPNAPQDVFLSGNDWPECIRSAFPTRGAFANTIREVSHAGGDSCLDDLLGQLTHTHDPFTFAASLEAIFERVDVGSGVEPDQKDTISNQIHHGLTVFGDSGDRHARHTAFVEILRAVAWISIQKGYIYRSNNSQRLTNAELLVPVIPLARDIAEIVDLSSATQKECQGIKKSFVRIVDIAAQNSMRNGVVAVTNDVADFRCITPRELLPAITMSVLEQSPKTSKKFVDYHQIKEEVVTLLLPPVSVLSLPRRTQNRLDMYPSASLPECAQRLLTEFLRKSKLKEAIGDWERPTWRKIPPTVRVMEADVQDVTFGLLQHKVPFIPASIANQLYTDAKDPQELWHRAENEMPNALSFFWSCVTLLDEDNRRELCEGTCAAAEMSLDAQNLERAIWGINLIIRHLQDLSEAEWSTLSLLLFRTLEDEAVDEDIRRSIARSMSNLPENIGRLNREIAADFASDIFPGL
ncbi:MAG: SIR2 family protein [Candidatus Brocadiia bacterium]